MFSMTGYGRAQRHWAGKEVTVEIRSVNHRYLDCSIRAPRILSFLEDAVKGVVSRHVARGKVDVFLSVDWGESDNIQVSLNRPVLEGYLDAAREMAEQYDLRDDLALSHFLRIPDVLIVRKEDIDADAFATEICAATEEALKGLNEMRRQEGEHLCADILARLASIETLVTQIEARSPVTVSEYRARLETKMKEVLADTAIEESRLLTEAALFADRVAVNEELVRLRSHMAQLRSMLRGGKSLGRKLDFLVQEFGREANTIGAKGNDAVMARLVVDLKAEIEKIREQVQNLE